jgi:hypothetical protein
LEFELEGYFQRRISDKYHRNIIENQFIPREQIPEIQKIENYGKPAVKPVVKTAQKLTIIEEARREQMERLKSEEKALAEKKHPTPKLKVQNLKSERDMLRNVADEIPDGQSIVPVKIQQDLLPVNQEGGLKFIKLNS